MKLGRINLDFFHPPYKRIIARTCRSMNRPFWRYHSLFIGQPYMAGLLGFSHKMTYPLFLRHLKIEVSFHPSCMYMGRHRIPDTAGFQFGHPHLQLTGLYVLINNQLIDYPIVRFRCRTSFDLIGIFQRHQFGRIVNSSLSLF